jgi:2-polyprenyl-3-methyl-5-hydroxy-6-metoxy-1,4-benzoquinol methylase
MAHTCPLCHSQDVELLTSWSREQLQKNYDLYEIRVDDLVQDTTDELQCLSCGLKFFHAEEGTELFYNRLMEKPWYYPNDKPEFTITSGYITKNDTVLEVGAGVGHYLNHIDPLFYQGLEFNPQAVAEAQALGRRVSNQTLAELDQLYTVVIAHQVLEHVADTDDFIRQCLTKLLPQGLLIFTVPSEEGIMGLLPNYCLNQPPHHMTKWRRSALNKIAEIHDLELVALEYETVVNPHHRELLGTDYSGYGHTVAAVYRKR